MPQAREITDIEPVMRKTSSSEELRALRIANLRPFKPGESGNPSGLSKNHFKIVDEAQRQAEKALRALVKVLDDDEAPPAAKIAAANSVLDRAYGKAAQMVDLKAEVSFSAQFEEFIRNLTAGSSAKVIEGQAE